MVLACAIAVAAAANTDIPRCARDDKLQIWRRSWPSTSSGQFRQACNLQVRTSVCCFDGTDASSSRWPVDPDRGQAEGLRGKHIVVNALAHVQNAVSGDTDAIQGEFENLQ